MRRHIHLGIWAMMTMAGLGCASTPEKPSEPRTEAPPALTGQYLSACTPQPQADGSTNYFTLDFDLSDTRWQLDYTVFTDDACASRALTVAIEGPYEMGGASDQVDGAWEGTFRFETKTMTPHTEFMADMLDGIDGCGAGGWQAGVTGDVAATGCAPFGQYALSDCSADYDIVSLSAEGIQFGARPTDNNMCTEDKRPTALSPLVNVRQ